MIQFTSKPLIKNNRKSTRGRKVQTIVFFNQETKKVESFNNAALASEMCHKVTNNKYTLGCIVKVSEEINEEAGGYWMQTANPLKVR